MAMRRGDEHAIPEVKAAAQTFRKQLFDPLFEAAKHVGIFKEDFDGIVNYLTRVYDTDKIIRQFPEFQARLVKWLQMGQEKALREIAELERAIADLGQEIERPTATMGERSRLANQELADRMASPEVDSIVDMAKFVREAPKQRPQTLSEWVIEQGGIKDFQGEATDIAKNDPRLRRLVRREWRAGAGRRPRRELGREDIATMARRAGAMRVLPFLHRQRLARRLAREDVERRQGFGRERDDGEERGEQGSHSWRRASIGSSLAARSAG